ncbi:MFS transporter [Corynebacterium sanguinis]|uniref:MFS transporter n=1 Tax=Corynebacterium sanguinis TaxID=2594913 RepID=UPI0021AE617D|nr:MFS transporter [Corynebacterium sanguinis]MCT1628337.1 MFS transporter [Corynebacterium sanguinis]
MTTGEDAHGCDYFTSIFLLPQLCNSTIRNITETSSSPLDILSVILSAVAFGGLVYALSSMSIILEGQGAERTLTITIAVVGVVALIWFIARQIKLQRDDRELLNLKPFTITNFTVSVVVLLIVFATLLGSVTVLPIFLQTAMGVSALTTGMLMLPGGLVNGILSPFIGRIYDAVGPRPLLWPGIVIATGSVFAMSRLDENSTTTQFIIIHIIFSISLALMISSLMTTALGALPAHLYGHGSAIVNTLQQLAGATGTALLVLVLTLGTEGSATAGAAVNVAAADGAQHAFVFATVMLAIGLVVSLFVKRNPLTVDVREEVEPQAAEDSAYDRA